MPKLRVFEVVGPIDDKTDETCKVWIGFRYRKIPPPGCQPPHAVSDEDFPCRCVVEKRWLEWKD